jgi:predicted aspartyl protease
VEFLLSQNTILSIEFVVDTGFNGYLTLPVSAVGAMNLPLFSTIIIIKNPNYPTEFGIPLLALVKTYLFLRHNLL